MKIWLCGQVGGQGEIDNIKEICSLSKYYDGLCWTVNYNNEDFSDNDGTYEELLKAKGQGKIVRANWVNINSLGMTMALQCGAIKGGDWVLFIDGNEIPKFQFAENFRNNVTDWDRKGIASVVWGRVYVFKFVENQTFQPTSVHCMVNPVYNRVLDIRAEDKVVYDEFGVHFSDFIYNKKKKENSMLLHGIKYCLFNVTNQMSMFYNGKELQEHENNRYWFCKHIEYKGYQRTLEGLEEFFKNKDNLTQEIMDYLQFEWVFRDFYRYKILGMSLDKVIENRYNSEIK